MPARFPTRQAAANYAVAYLNYFHPDWPTSRVRTAEADAGIQGLGYRAEIKGDNGRWQALDRIRLLDHDKKGWRPK